MGEYKIKLYYSTGNSCMSEDVSDYLELTWKNLNIAKENLQRIKEHYAMHRELHGYNSGDKIFEKNKNKEWFVNSPKLYCISSNNAISEKDKKKVGENNWEYRPDTYFAEHCINLKTDFGENMQIGAYWTGHFESLKTAEIEIDNTEMKIEF